MRVTIYARVSTSDQKSVREVEEYVVHPNQIKKLKFGQSLNVHPGSIMFSGYEEVA
jgi:predicted site-specific integrase-resolvase